MPTVVQLVRVSTEEQAAEGRAGLARQEHSCDDTAARYGLQVARRYSLVGVSGNRVADTPEWAEVAALLRARAVDGILVDAVDRLLRADEWDFRVFAALAESGARIWTGAGPRDLSEPGDSLLVGILALLGGQEKREIARRARAGKEAKRRKGGWVQPRSWLPIGVDYERTAEEGARWSYTADVATVVQMFRRFALGDLSMRSLAKAFRTTEATARKRLTNPLYNGWLVYDQTTGPKRREVGGRQASRRRVPREPEQVIRVRVLDPPAVTDAEWARVQALLAESRRIYAPREGTSEERWPLRGMLRCARCGGPVHTRTNTSGDSYVCGAKARSGEVGYHGTRCTAGAVGVGRLHAAVCQVLVDQVATPRALAALLEAHLERESTGEAERRIAASEKRVAAAEARRVRLLQLYLEGGWTPAELEPQKIAIDRELAAATAELDRLQATVPLRSRDVSAVAVRLALALRSVAQMTPAELRAMLLPLRPTFTMDKDTGPRRPVTITRLELDVSGLVTDERRADVAAVVVAVDL